jgi:hypothetical protein
MHEESRCWKKSLRVVSWLNEIHSLRPSWSSSNQSWQVQKKHQLIQYCRSHWKSHVCLKVKGNWPKNWIRSKVHKYRSPFKGVRNIKFSSKWNKNIRTHYKHRWAKSVTSPIRSVVERLKIYPERKRQYSHRNYINWRRRLLINSRKRLRCWHSRSRPR